MSFKDKDWAARFAAMGDESEGRFEEWCATTATSYVRFGFDRPPIQMAGLPTRLRYAPDYLLTNSFVEVQGFGRDQLFKLKIEKHGSLRWWSDLHPVELYVWDSHKQRDTFITLDDIDKWMCDERTKLEHFPEMKPYISIPAGLIFSEA